MNPARTGLQLRSHVKRSGELELTLASQILPQPAPDEVVLRVEATPINPSDIGLLFGAADLGTLKASSGTSGPVVTATIPEAAMSAMAARMDLPMPVGNEGAGLVVEAGSSPAAKALLGKTVAVLGGAMYAQYRCVKADQCLVLPPGTTAAEGASCFVNPLTALGMVHTLKLEGHKALVHTAAASNLGQMLNRLCMADGIGLVNIVRNPEQEALLRGIGAAHVCDSSSPAFLEELTAAVHATGATLAFDAIGGGRLPGLILTAMEASISPQVGEYSRYGSNVHKQVYLYGGLDTSPTVITRNFGMTWGMGGWLLFQFLQRIGTAQAHALRQRVAAELQTTFASSYSDEISLHEALKPEVIAQYTRRATGVKFLINPNKGTPPG
jgi:NADPH2:quinone reductase